MGGGRPGKRVNAAVWTMCVQCWPPASVLMGVPRGAGVRVGFLTVL